LQGGHAAFILGGMKILNKFVVVLLVALFANSPLYAVCTPEGCGGFTPCEQLLMDGGFDEPSCHSYWFRSGSTSIVDNVADAYGRLYGSGSITQLVDVPSGYSTHEIGFQIDVVPGSSSTGSERLLVEIVQPNGVVLETVAVLTPTTTDGIYNFYIDSYATFNVGLRFRYTTGSTPAGTEFRVQHASWWEH
jgi:hypothetical protein